MTKGAFNKTKALFPSKFDVNLRKKLVKCYIWNIALYGAETWTLRKIDQKYLEDFEMWCWRRKEIIWTDRVMSEILHIVKEERNILKTIKMKKANWIGHILHRNFTEGKIEGRIDVTGRQGRRHKKLLEDLKEKKGYWKLKEEALLHTLWRTRFGSGYGVVRQTTE
jgi:hypothetical protein